MDLVQKYDEKYNNNIYCSVYGDLLKLSDIESKKVKWK